MASVEVNLSALNRFLTRTVQPFLVTKADQIAAEVKVRAPLGATGDLRNSVRVIRRPDGGVTVNVTAPYAGFVETGTGPQHVPGANPPYIPRLRRRGLILWSDANKANPYKVRHGIAQSGTRSVPFLEESIQHVLAGFKFRWIRKDLQV